MCYGGLRIRGPPPRRTASLWRRRRPSRRSSSGSLPLPPGSGLQEDTDGRSGAAEERLNGKDTGVKYGNLSHDYSRRRMMARLRRHKAYWSPLSFVRLHVSEGISHFPVWLVGDLRSDAFLQGASIQVRRDPLGENSLM